MGILEKVWGQIARIFSPPTKRCRVCDTMLSSLNSKGVCRTPSCENEDEVLKLHDSGL